ncbi:MAG: hypothetical protein R3D00_07015 [Bacteroidia bacterium]
MPKRNLLLLLVFVFVFLRLSAQTAPAANADALPYYEIPAYPDSFSAENVVARMIDGLGFRYYWATEGLRAEDLAFRPSPEARTSEETIDHIMGLSAVILNGIKQQPNVRSGEETSTLSFEVKRKTTLENLKEASDRLKTSGAKLEDYNIVFMNGDSKTEFPFWNMLNGPISDALWHVGQVITFRRSSGNPFNSKASVLTGKVRQ